MFEIAAIDAGNIGKRLPQSPKRFTGDRCRQAILVCLPLSHLTHPPRSRQGASRWGNLKAPVKTQGRQLADRPMRTRVFTGAWPGEQHGEGLAGEKLEDCKNKSKRAVCQSLGAFV